MIATSRLQKKFKLQQDASIRNFVSHFFLSPIMSETANISNQVASEIYRIFYGNLWNFAGAFVCTQGSCIQNFRFLASVQHLCCQKTWFQCKISQNKPFSSKKCSNSFSNGPEGLKFCVLGYLYTSQSHAKFQPSRSTRKKIIGKKPLLETHKISVFC